ncbi:MAG: deoxyribodipyrimidine photo-lyase [Bacteroidetes bacterium]|nr:deoxyribodipyrimidine photo-lyase [Bacteroidota bacterium]
MTQKPITIYWMRRDLRLGDNAALYHALREGEAVLPLFIFDTNILDKLHDRQDRRVQFIYDELQKIAAELRKHGSDLLIKTGKPLEIWRELLKEYQIAAVHTNEDYEPYARDRDGKVGEMLFGHKVPFNTYKDHVIFAKSEVVKSDGNPYTIYTPYSRRWREKLKPFYYKAYPTEKYFSRLMKVSKHLYFPTLADIGFKAVDCDYPARVAKADIVNKYDKQRDYPAIEGTTRLGLHLRFGTLSIRKLLAYGLQHNQTFVNELIWRDFYQQILWHFPQVAREAFRPEYDFIRWVNDEKQFKAWCEGNTGYPLVDAGMRELNATGYMHNRVRMVVASFLAKHLLIDWRWGEAYFAEKLLDFDLAANNGGWQWAAGCGTDAAPYFRVFNPELQLKKFDAELKYVRKWVPEYGTPQYPQPIVEHEFARKRCLEVYKKALKKEE